MAPKRHMAGQIIAKLRKKTENPHGNHPHQHGLAFRCVPENVGITFGIVQRQLAWDGESANHLISLMAMEDQGTGRRDFFRDALRQIVRPLVDYVEKRTPDSWDQTRLRPPGAIQEERFLETCRRCGACVEACPADAIIPASATDGREAGTPVIDPDRAACVVCTGLKCTHVCPSGALLPLFRARSIRMGLAEVYRPLCVRSRDETCTICVENCPLGEDALWFPDDGPPEVRSAGCVGCGMCQLSCPTAPKAIVVKPPS